MSVLLGINLVIMVAMSALLIDWVRDRASVRRFVRTFKDLPSDPHDLALEVAARIANRPRAESDPVYLTKVFVPFGATPRSVIRSGGCCSGTSRLYMVVLAELGLRANQITVYHREGHAQHCLVEVHLSPRPLIVDPVYGLYYTDQAGGNLSLEDLQAGAEVHERPIPIATNPGYPDNDYYDFDYALTKTANWTMSGVRRSVYSVLARLGHRSIDRLRVPQVLEWPQTLLALFLAGVAGIANGIGMLVLLLAMV